MSEARSRGRWKIWHFAAVVPAFGLVFAAIRPVAKDRGLLEEGLSMLVLVTLAGTTPLALIRLGRVAARWTTGPLKRWGLERGSSIGFVAWVGSMAVESGYYLSALLISPIAAIILLLWLSGRIGR